MSNVAAAVVVAVGRRRGSPAVRGGETRRRSRVYHRVDSITRVESESREKWHRRVGTANRLQRIMIEQACSRLVPGR